MIRTKYSINELLEKKSYGIRIVLYGAGSTGILVRKLLKLCGLKADWYVDNAPQKRNSIIGELICCFPDDIKEKDNCIVFICVAWEKASEVYERAVSDGFSNIYHIQGIIDDILINKRHLLTEVLNLLYEEGISNVFTNYPNESYVPKIELRSKSTIKGNIAVYTSVFGKYDNIYPPKVECDNVHYYYVSDDRPSNLKEFRWIDASSIIPERIKSPIKRNRFIKMHPHLLFPEYEYSVYMDGVIEIIGDIRGYFRENRIGISVFKYYNRDCLYYEALQMANYKRVTVEDIYHQISRYLDEGYPLHYGMTEMPIIAREHNRKECIKIMDDWWEEFDKTAQRDQLSFMYVMWKNGYSIDDLGLIGTDFRKASEYIYHQHIADSKDVSNPQRSK